MRNQKKNLLLVGSTVAMTAVAATAAAITASCATTETNNEQELNNSQKSFMSLDSKVNVLINTLVDVDKKDKFIGKEMYKNTFDKLRRLQYDEVKSYKKLNADETNKIDSVTADYLQKYYVLVDEFVTTYKEEVKNAEEVEKQLDGKKYDGLAAYQEKISKSNEAISIYNDPSTSDANKAERITSLVETEKELWNATVDMQKTLNGETDESKLMYEFALKTAQALMNYSEDKQGYESIFDDLFVRNFYAQKMVLPETNSDYAKAYNYLWPETQDVHGEKFIGFYRDEILFARDLSSKMNDIADTKEQEFKTALDVEIKNSSDLISGFNVTLLAKIDGKIKLDEALKFAQTYKMEKEERIRAQLLKEQKDAYDKKLAEIMDMEQQLQDPKYAIILEELKTSKEAETTPISEKEKNNTIEPNDYNIATAKLQLALNKAKIAKEEKDKLDVASKAYEDKLAEVKSYSKDTLSTNPIYVTTKTTLDSEVKVVEDRVTAETNKTVELYNKGVEDLNKALEKAKLDKEKMDAKAAYEASKTRAETLSTELKKETKYNAISTDLDAEIEKAQTEANKDMTSDYGVAKDILDKAIEKATKDKNDYELNQAKTKYEAKVNEANTKPLDDYPTTKANLMTQLENIDNNLANPRTVESYEAATKLVQAEIDKLEYLKAKENNKKEADKYTDPKYVNAISYNSQKVAEQDTVVNSPDVQSEKINKATNKVTKLTKLLMEYSKYIDKLLEAKSDKDSFDDDQIKIDYNSKIEMINTTATADEKTKDKFEKGITDLNSTMLWANKAKYDKSHKAVRDYFSTNIVSLGKDYKDQYEEFQNKFNEIQNKVNTSTTYAEYKTYSKELDTLLTTTKEKVERRKLQLAYLSALDEFVTAQKNYANNENTGTQNNKQTLLQTAQEKYQAYVAAAQAYGEQTILQFSTTKK
ncbi:hypothetical protein [Mycoplasma miroungirhinis]|uniref:Lipoprotein n=1 Tax=Mycoplasma miroungirhinis TaxID=754516 RepID=A0A6M4JIH7_9MOLU|nr:hypothetical protein [Mycoplasma miroungirhinis]QJR44281.1 hypothetical protein HLA92_02455 [Mycoplasma miroungirhinis]